MANTELTLVLPGLAAILEQKINASVIPPYLAKVISKAQFQQDLTGLSRLLFSHFSESPLTGSDLPIAHLEQENTNTLRADPCYLHADRDRLLLFADNSELSYDESAALIAEIQPLFDEFGGELIQSRPDNWILKMQTMPDLNFSALPEVTGKGVESYLPKGSEQQDWIRLWNEVQMKLYASELNQRRSDEGKLAINSVWFWGAGTFICKESPWTRIQGQSSLLKQLADRSQCPLEKNSDYSVASLSTGKHLWLVDEIVIEEDWLQQLQVFDDTVLKPLWQHCRQAKLTTIQLQIPDHGSYQLTPLDCWKFWK